jgi:hypothetical protein
MKRGRQQSWERQQPKGGYVRWRWQFDLTPDESQRLEQLLNEPTGQSLSALILAAVRTAEDV